MAIFFFVSCNSAGSEQGRLGDVKIKEFLARSVLKGIVFVNYKVFLVYFFFCLMSECVFVDGVFFELLFLCVLSK